MAGGANYAVAGVKRFDVEAANQTRAMRAAKARSQAQNRATV
jgi:hypothetical protein